MQRRHLLHLPGLAALGTNASAATDGITETWHDPARDRSLPVRLRLPAGTGPAPAILLSHGLGGSRDGLGYLGRALAAAGFVAVHLQHPGTDSALWQGRADAFMAMAAAVADPGQALARLQDGIFALDELEQRNAMPGPLHGRVELGRLGIAGHSYGAWTVQHLLGERLPGGEHGLRLPDPRLRAGIALSPVPPRRMPAEIAFARVKRPMLHVTGTADHGYMEGATPADREIPFRAISGTPQALAVLSGASHGAFADEAAAGARWADPAFHGRTAALAVAFLRAMLLDDAAAAAALRDGLKGVLAAADRLETKDFPDFG
jgi:predicted dienelactone hydrolase